MLPTARFPSTAALPLLLLALPAQAVTLRVTTTQDVVADDGSCSLREAVIAANDDFPSGFTPGECPAGSGADLIELETPGTYRLTIPGQGEGFAATGDLDILESVEIVGGDPVAFVVDGGLLDRVFDIGSGASTVTLRGLTVTGGDLSSSGIADGGGIDNDGGLSLVSVVVRNNSVGDDGGGVYNDGDLSLVDSRVEGNSAADGGGIYNDCCSATLIIQGTTIAGNSASDDGGGLVSEEPMTMTDSAVSENTALDDGGGIWIGDPSTIERSTIDGNHALADGGGIFAADDVTLVDVTLSGNIADFEGGGLFNDADSAITNTTITGNTAPSGSALFNDDSVDVLEIGNTIVDGRCAGIPPTSRGGNVESPGNTCDLMLPSDRGAVSAAALALSPLADHGGPTESHHLLAGSVAIDTALDSLCPVLDQRGLARPADGDDDSIAVCDAGAVEVQPCLTSDVVVLDGETVTGTEVVEACQEIQAGNGYRVLAPGDVTLRAGQRIVLADGFEVGDGATFAAEADPLAGR